MLGAQKNKTNKQKKMFHMIENLSLLDLIPEGDNMHGNILKALDYSAIKTLLTPFTQHLSPIFVQLKTLGGSPSLKQNFSTSASLTFWAG